LGLTPTNWAPWRGLIVTLGGQGYKNKAITLDMAGKGEQNLVLVFTLREVHAEKVQEGEQRGHMFGFCRRIGRLGLGVLGRNV